MMKIGALSRDATAVVVTLVLVLGARQGSAQFPTPAPTVTCQSELSDAVTCLVQNNLNATACLLCEGSYYEGVTNETTCGELTNDICGLLDTCTQYCGPCNSELVVYETCYWGSSCFLPCSDPSLPTAPNSAPAPSPASFPTSPTTSTDDGMCPDEKDALVTCVAGTSDPQTCITCLTNLPAATTCADVVTKSCAIDEQCPSCTGCEDEYVSLNNCLNAGTCDAITCSTSNPALAPAPSPVSVPTSPTTSTDDGVCPDEKDALGTCISATSDPQTCLTCLTNLPAATTCADVATKSCAINEQCPSCTGCEDEYVNLNNCFNVGLCDAITCATPSASDIPTSSPVLAVTTKGPISSSSPVATPTGPTPTVGDQCATEMATLQGCLSTDITSGAATSCQACVTNAFQGLFPTATTRQSQPTCATINNGLCAAVFATCNCGTCSDEYETYLNCQVAELATGCALDCSGPTGPTPAGTSSGGRARTGLAGLFLGMVALVL